MEQNNKNNNMEEKSTGGQKNTEEQKPVSSYPKGVRRIALVGAVLLVLMYIVTLIAALTTSPASGGLFKACLGGSILLPVMLWLYTRFAKLFRDKNIEA